MIPIQLLFIRLIQVYRSLIKIPLHALLILAALIVLAKICFEFFLNPVYAVLISFALGAVVLTIQYYRNDKKFVYQYLNYPRLQLHLEYTFFSSFLMLGCFFSVHWYCFFILQGLIYGITYFQFPSHYQTPLRKLGKWIPASNFEIISGVRKSYLLLIPLYIISLMVTSINFLPLFIIWFINISVLGFFQEYESIQMITCNPYKRHRFLFFKILINVLFLNIFYVPVVALNWYFHQDLTLICSLFLLTQSILIAFAVLQKYAYYDPSSYARGSGIVTAVIAICSMVPFTFPIPLVLCVIYYYRANKNLKPYLL